jgi:CheY-like chemotaxis protein
MDHHRAFVLLIQRDPAVAASIRRLLTERGEGAYQLQCVESVPTALARIGGGGVDVIMLDLSLHQDRSRNSLVSCPFGRPPRRYRSSFCTLLPMKASR